MGICAQWAERSMWNCCCVYCRGIFFFKYTRRKSSANLAQYHSVVGWHWRCCTAAAADGVLCEFEVSVGAAERIYMFDIRGVVTTNEQTMSLYMYAHSCKSLNIYTWFKAEIYWSWVQCVRICVRRSNIKWLLVARARYIVDDLPCELVTLAQMFHTKKSTSKYFKGYSFSFGRVYWERERQKGERNKRRNF